MMNSDAVLMMIDQIAATSSNKDKVSMIAAFGQDEMFRRVLQYTYDPFKTFGVIPQRPAANGFLQFDSETWGLLDSLIARSLTGDAARQMLSEAFGHLTSASADLLWRIINKDMRAGFSETLINTAIKGLIPEFPYMRCSLPKHIKMESWDWEAGVYSQVKADGMFANIDHEHGGIVRITSRQGSQFPINQFCALEVEVRARLISGTQSHGEILVMRDEVVLPREQGNGVLNSVLKGGSFSGNEVPVFVVWDQIPLSAVQPKGHYEVTYPMRFEALERQVGDGLIRLIENRVVHSHAEAMTHYRDVLSAGGEGTVLKSVEAIWRDGTSREQVKMKLEVDVDLMITGFTPGNGKHASTFGSVICHSSDLLLEVAVSGFSDKQRADIHAKRDSVLGKIMTVKANAVMVPQNPRDKHSLFLPRHVEIREDKVCADSLQSIKDQFEAATMN